MVFRLILIACLGSEALLRVFSCWLLVVGLNAGQVWHDSCEPLSVFARLAKFCFHFKLFDVVILLDFEDGLSFYCFLLGFSWFF